MPNRPYRPGNIITPGTPPRQTQPGITFNPGRDGSDSRSGRHGNTVILYYPFAYGYGGYSYTNDGYIDNGAANSGGVTRTNPQASYSIEGHLDDSATREPHSRVYEVGPGTSDNSVETRPVAPGQRTGEVSAGKTENPVTLVALKGGLVYAVTEHWMLGNTVHFVTVEDEHYVVSLQEVDLDLSARLNRERGMKFVLEVREQTHPTPEAAR